MKLKTFNTTTVPSLRSQTPSVGINTKTGTFQFNRSAYDLIGIDTGDQVQILQDESEPDCFYVEKVKQDGFALRAKTGASAPSGGGIFNNSVVSREIQKALELPSHTFKMLIAGKPTEEGKRKLWGLLRSGL